MNPNFLRTSFSFAEIERLQKGEVKKEPEKETYLDLFATKNHKLKERVLIPTKQYPRVTILTAYHLSFGLCLLFLDAFGLLD